MDRVTQAARWITQANAALDRLKDPLLLAIRVYWGWSLMWNGWGKLHNLSGIAQWFGEELHLPFPYANAIAAATTEFLGSLLLMLGLATRPAAAAIAFTMTVAYLTSDREVLSTLTTDFFCQSGTQVGECFVLAAPFPYWFAGILILVLGPGKIALDTLVARWWANR
jgi:putative oxidoreductase